MSEYHYILVCYDISDNTRRRQLIRKLEDNGMQRIQFSIFLCAYTHNSLSQLRHAVESVITKDDNVAIIPMCATCQCSSLLYNVPTINRPGESAVW